METPAVLITVVIYTIKQSLTLVLQLYNCVLFCLKIESTYQIGIKAGLSNTESVMGFKLA